MLFRVHYFRTQALKCIRKKSSKTNNKVVQSALWYHRASSPWTMTFETERHLNRGSETNRSTTKKPRKNLNKGQHNYHLIIASAIIDASHKYFFYFFCKSLEKCWTKNYVNSCNFYTTAKRREETTEKNKNMLIHLNKYRNSDEGKNACDSKLAIS